MKAFTFHAPQALADAVTLLGQHGAEARPIAGGQSLLLAMKERAATPSVLVSLSGVADLRGWHQDGDGLHIGSGTTYAALAGSTFPTWQQEIATVAGNLADRPVRTMGTIGGALCQAEPRFDMPALALGLDATMALVSASGVRTLPASEFFRPEGGTVLQAGEILSRVSFPPAARFSGVAFEKFRVRVFDAALVSAVCAVRVGVPAEARLVVGGVRPTPVEVPGVAAELAADLDGADPAELGRRCADEVLPAAEATTSLARYQRELVAVVARDAVIRALATARS
ncbi:MAG: aerobic carbon-monoxide dehydrogenase medium subunit [Actinomycetota bacterium]|nr:aerobic carbon-monoxide dehydrogenase medium subunit [Actinomycetota bacterium]